MLEYLYALINFLILFFILFIFARKSIKKIFSSRRERISAQLDALYAEPKENAELPVQKVEKKTNKSSLEENEVAKMEAMLAITLKEIEKETGNLCTNMRREMLYEVRNSFVQKIVEYTEQLLTTPEFIAKMQDKQSEIANSILSSVQITPGDITYLRTKYELYVTLMSAQPLQQNVIEEVDHKTAEIVEKVGGKTSFRVRIVPELLGGIQLRVGDTIYGCSVDDELYALKSRLRKSSIDEDEDAESILKDVMDAVKVMHFDVHVFQRGRVLSVSDGICWMDGLSDIMYGEVVSLENNQKGMVLDIKKDRIGCMIFGQYEHIDTGSMVLRVGRMAAVPVGKELLGRIVDPMGNPMDGQGKIWTNETRPLEFSAPTIPERKSVYRPLETGIKAIDALVPIGRGQRELIIGDRQTGKTAIALDAILNQKGKKTACIYVAIGQKESTIAEMRKRLIEGGAMDYTTIVCASASSSAAYQYIAPFAGVAMAEYFMYNGMDALIIYDDLSKHAVAYREISLLLHRPSGREAYPGDIFYLHSRLLERAAQLSDELGGGSMTALPIIETQSGDISAYIPTNVISITDGQIFLESDLFNQGQRPAVNVGLSVSRVGGAAQTPLMKQTAASLRVQLAQYRELESFFQFGTELDESTKKVLEAGKRMMAALRQPRFATLPSWKQALILFAVENGFTADITPEEVGNFENRLFAYIESNCSAMADRLKQGEKLQKEEKEELINLIAKMQEVV